MEAKQVSVIIPTYNRAGLLGQTLESIAAQSFRDWECVVVDDGSTDNTKELLSRFIQKDARFRFAERPASRTKGANAARNYGYELSTGKYIKFFDSDDLMHPDFLMRQFAVLEDNPKLDFCAAFSKRFSDSANDAFEDYNPEITSNTDSLYHFITGKLFFLTPAPLWRKSFLEGQSLFDERLYNAHETEFNFRMLAAGARFEYLTENLFFVRRGHDSIDNGARMSADSYQSQFDYFEKVHRYLNSDASIFSGEKATALKNYAIFRKAVIFSCVRQLGGKKSAAADFRILRSQITSAPMPKGQKLSMLFGIYLIWYFEKGYTFIYRQSLDLRN